MSEEDAADVIEAREEAHELIYSAILQFVAMNKSGKNNLLRLLGLEYALLRSAARIALIKDEHGAQNVRKLFMRMAREEYEEALKYRARKSPSKPRKPKAPILKIVE